MWSLWPTGWISIGSAVLAALSRGRGGRLAGSRSVHACWQHSAVVVVADWLYVLAVLVLAHVTDQQHVTVGYVARVLARVCRRTSHTTTQPPFIVTRPN